MSKVIEYIDSSANDKWRWIQKEPKGLEIFLKRGQILVAILQKIKECSSQEELGPIFKHEYLHKNTILHMLSQEPLSANQMNLVMTTLLQKTVEPHAKNSAGKTFLELSPIKKKLLQEIQKVSDDWVETFYGEPKLIQSWIKLGDDDLLETLLQQLRQSLSFKNYNW